MHFRTTRWHKYSTQCGKRGCSFLFKLWKWNPMGVRIYSFDFCFYGVVMLWSFYCTKTRRNWGNVCYTTIWCFSLWSWDATWGHHRSESTLAQAPSHNMDQLWLIISGALWDSNEIKKYRSLLWIWRSSPVSVCQYCVVIIPNRFIHKLTFAYVNISHFYRWMIGKVYSEVLKEMNV